MSDFVCTLALAFLCLFAWEMHKLDTLPQRERLEQRLHACEGECAPYHVAEFGPYVGCRCRP